MPPFPHAAVSCGVRSAAVPDESKADHPQGDTEPLPPLFTIHVFTPHVLLT